MCEPTGQGGGGFDHLHEVDEQHEGVVDPAFVGIAERGAGEVEVREEMRGFLFRKLDGEGELAVPEAAVMGGGIAEHAKVVQQGAEGFFQT